MSTIENENIYGIGFCRKQNLAIEGGKGSYVWDEEGKRFLDCTSGWGVTCLGHAHPTVTEAIVEQAGKIIQNPNSGFTYSPVRSRLLRLMSDVLPVGLSRTFFVNSGAEANDAALKLARKLTGRRGVLSTRESFHGRTFGTLSVTGGERQVERFAPGPTDTTFVPFGDASAVAQALHEGIAAVIVEPVQGEGGVRIPPPGYLAELGRLCQANSSYLIVDEVQTGFGRTGKLFAIEHSPESVRPDFLTMGKGLAGGFPFAALAVSEQVASQIETGDHGGTYCGNPLGCAVAYAVVKFLLDNDVPSRSAEAGRILLTGLENLSSRYRGLIRDVRGIGLLTAIELYSDESAWNLTQACAEKGLLVTPTRGAIVRLIPDLLIDSANLQQALAILDSALGSIDTRVAAAS